jgi:hypothetical protein
LAAGFFAFAAGFLAAGLATGFLAGAFFTAAGFLAGAGLALTGFATAGATTSVRTGGSTLYGAALTASTLDSVFGASTGLPKKNSLIALNIGSPKNVIVYLISDSSLGKFLDFNGLY